MTLSTIDPAEAATLLSWWLESGVDIAVAEAPRDWLKPAAAPEARAAAAPVTSGAMPEGFAEFRAWIEVSPGLPLGRPGARRVLPVGVAGAKVMLVSDLPGRTDEGRPIGGEAWALSLRMLAAIGVSPDQAYVASLACFDAPGERIGGDELLRCGEIARAHVRAVAPERLILLGDAPARALLGEPLARARGRLHKVEGVPAIATFHPRWLMQRPSDKALAWSDLLQLMSVEG